MAERIEKDALGEMRLPAETLWGINTQRALENFNVSGRQTPVELLHALGEVKWAAAKTNADLGFLPQAIAEVIIQAAQELRDGKLDDYLVVDAMQGGAGTSTHLNVCEVLANRALQLLGKRPGEYQFCDPLDHVNLHQSTNDAYATAMRIALVRLTQAAEMSMVKLQEAFQDKEREFAAVIKTGRTEMMDAVPLTLGRTFGAWAEALTRDRWRISKTLDRLRLINLGGTAIGTGLGAPRKYIFQVSEELRRITGLPLARADNLLEATQNQDIILELMGVVKTHAMTLMKISQDLRLLNSGPDTGLGELELPAVQVGSSIMPYKFNPVMPEMLFQTAVQVSAHEHAIGLAVGAGQLELNAYLPLIALNAIDALKLLRETNLRFAERCVKGIRAHAEKCRTAAMASRSISTVLIPRVGYQQASAVAQYMKNQQCDLKTAALAVTALTAEELDQMMTPQALTSLGF